MILHSFSKLALRIHQTMTNNTSFWDKIFWFFTLWRNQEANVRQVPNLPLKTGHSALQFHHIEDSAVVWLRQVSEVQKQKCPTCKVTNPYPTPHLHEKNITWWYLLWKQIWDIFSYPYLCVLCTGLFYRFVEGSLTVLVPEIQVGPVGNQQLDDFICLIQGCSDGERCLWENRKKKNVQLEEM